MPKVGVWNGFLLMVYNNDHPPAHVHVKRDEWNVRVFLADLSSNVKSGNPTASELRAAEAVVAENRSKCYKAWRNRNT
jgi:hypothetical protein